MRVVVMLFVVLFSLFGAAGGNAVGPTLPPIAKYSAFEVRGRVSTVFTVSVSGGSCPSGYEETIAKIWVNDDVRTVSVRIPEGMTPPSASDCVLVIGMLVPSCTGDDQVLALVSHYTADDTCD